MGRPNVGKSTLFDRLVGMRAWFPYAVSGRAARGALGFRKASAGRLERTGFYRKITYSSTHAANQAAVNLSQSKMGLVAIVGRPNVGKSTLFNRLVGMRKAIVNDTAGTGAPATAITARPTGTAGEFSVIDTGGYALGGEDIFEEEIRKQVVLAVEEADVILFLVEVSTGITDLDMAVADLLRRTSKKVILVVNKVDNNNLVYGSHEFYALGLGDPYCISSISGSGTGDLMDAVVAALPPDTEAEQTDDLPKFAIVGRPNVGKSSLTNALLDRERNIVTPIAGTTRDSILTRYNKFGMDFYLIDTAGLRRKPK